MSAGSTARAVGEALRVGVDVGGTFTKAVAVDPRSLAIRAQAVVATTHRAAAGVSEGVALALRELLDRLDNAGTVELVAFSTTQAMNALLEGDVPRVGVVGIGTAPELRPARRRTRVGRVELAPGRALETEHAFIDATHGLDEAEIDRALDHLAGAGCRAIAVSGAFAVDAPEHERLVSDQARARGLAVCAGHELTGAYGLETRTVTAALNASILPVVQRTAAVVEQALADAGLAAPLLVLRGDGGAMGVDVFRRTPTFTIGSGPAAGVAAALHQLSLSEGIVLECGGTSSNVSVVKNGRTVLRSLKVMGRPTSVRSVDSWVVGAAGGSLARLGRRGIAEVGPRSAHLAGLPYACFAGLERLAGAELELIPPRAGDPPAYAVIRAGGERYALTATCAANALGVPPSGAYAEGSSRAALAAFAPLAERLRRSPESAARALLDGAVGKIAQAVAEAARQHELGQGVPLVALGGAAQALAPELARRLGRPLLSPDHPEVLSSIGAAASLVRAEAARTSVAPGASVLVASEAEDACVAAGAAPATITVETSFDPREGVVRAAASGAVALEAGAARRQPVDESTRRQSAAASLGIEAGDIELLATNRFYHVYSENGSGRVAVVDGRGGVPLAENARRILAGEPRRVLDQLGEALTAASLQLGVATLLPRVTLVCGSRLLDLSDARRPEDVLAAAADALAVEDEQAVAVLSR